MNRPTDTGNSAQDLPGFLNSDQDAPASATTENVTTEDETTYYEDAESEEGSDEAYDEQDYDETDVVADPTPVRHRTRTTARSTRSRHGASTPSGGGFMLTAGWLLAIAGVVTMFMPAATVAMARFIEPQILLILGALVVAIAAGKRRTSLLQQRLAQMQEQRNDADDELHELLAELAQNKNTAPGGEAPDVQHMMLSLQRQDQKINNLTKAIKMYGKPLMEIAGQGTELAGSVAQVKALVEGAAESTRQAVNRVEQHVRDGGNSADFGDLPDQIGKLEVSLAAIAQRLEDSEVRKSLVRLEDTCKLLGMQLEDLSRGETIKTSATELQQSLDKATAGLAKSIAQLRDGNVNGLESSVKDIQRELAGLATGMSQVQNAVKNGVRAGGTAPAAAQTPTAPAQAQAAPAPAAATPTPQTAKAPATSGGASKDTGADGYATGKRKVGSKNVLGAIAKLKQMKG